jgi:hypothetical protein
MEDKTPSRKRIGLSLPRRQQQDALKRRRARVEESKKYIHLMII